MKLWKLSRLPFFLATDIYTSVYSVYLLLRDSIFLFMKNDKFWCAKKAAACLLFEQTGRVTSRLKLVS